MVLSRRSYALVFTTLPMEADTAFAAGETARPFGAAPAAACECAAPALGVLALCAGCAVALEIGFTDMRLLPGATEF
jgi:hypothetical protein